MLAFLGRALCGVLVVLGLVDQHHSSAKTELKLLGRQPGAAVAQLDPTTIQPVCAYQEEVACRVYRVTAYCDRGLTAGGVPSGVGQCAAPADIPFGARVYIPTLERTFVVTDRTARRFRHNTVDLFIPDREACLKFGRRYLECEITLPAEALSYGSPRLHAAL